MGCCCRCSERRQKYWLFGCSIFTLFLALALGLLWPTLAWKLITDKLILINGSLNFENWIVTPIPIYLEITLFNWTNSDQLYNRSVKPSFAEMGPYVFLQKQQRDDVVWNDADDVIAFNQTKTWFFLPEKSNGSLDDLITNLNVMTVTTAYMVRNQGRIIKMVTNYIINDRGGGKAIITKTARELLFDGYDDPLLDFIRSTNSSTINIPFKKFGWFVERNGSSEYDGRFTMNTGKSDINELGIVRTWNNESRVPFYRDTCGMINGTTGELWPPIRVPDNPITMFATDFCRSFTLNYSGEVDFYGVAGRRWIGDRNVFGYGDEYPENICFCTGDPSTCPDLPSGTLNVSDCRYGAPAFVSFPHFYLADESYVTNIDGMKPNREKHEFSLSLEPKTGIPLEVNARLQINILMQPDNAISIFKNVPKAMIPMFWFRQFVQIDEDLAGQAKLALMLPSMGVWTAYGLAGIGLILTLIGIGLVVSWCRRDRTVDNNHERFIDEETEDQ